MPGEFFVAGGQQEEGGCSRQASSPHSPWAHQVPDNDDDDDDDDDDNDDDDINDSDSPRSDNGAIVKCQASNSIGKSEETRTLNIFCKSDNEMMVVLNTTRKKWSGNLSSNAAFFNGHKKYAYYERQHVCMCILYTE